MMGGITEMLALMAEVTASESEWFVTAGVFVAVIAMLVGYILGRIDGRRKR